MFSIVAEKYMAENPRRDRTEKPMKAEFQKFVESMGGDKSIDAITKADGRTYKDHLLNVRKVAIRT
ncbi:MAG TPA: hypothetical protein VFS39_01655, partial [Nitrospira sp.]|nr:hypothetical protein [Nitrospira sp.]